MSAKSIVSNTILMYSGEGISKIAQFIFIILLTRYLGAESFGKISFALALGWIIVTFSDVGIASILFREMSTNPAKILKHINHAMLLRMIITSIVLLLIFLGMVGMHFSYERILVIMIISVSFALDSTAQLLRTAIVSSKKMGYESVLKIVFGGSKLALFLIMQSLNTGLVPMALVYLLSSVLTLLLSYIFYRIRIGKIQLTIKKKYTKWLLKESYPLLFTSVFGMLLLNMDIIMLGWLKGDAATGLYSAASRLIMSGYIVSEILATTIYPYVCTYISKNPIYYERLVKTAFNVCFLVFIPISVISSVFHDRIILFLYGTEFVEGSIVLGIFTFTLFAYAFPHFFGGLFIITHRTKTLTYILTVGTATNIILNYILIQKYSFIGAAIATTASFVIIAVMLYFVYNMHQKKLHIGSQLLRLGIITATMIGISYMLKDFSIIKIVGLTVPPYIILIFLFRIISKEDILLVLNSLKTNKAACLISKFTKR